MARQDKVPAAEGAVLFLEKVSPALAYVDGSSGAIGNVAIRAVATLAEIVSTAPADRAVRRKWLDRLFAAHAAGDIPYGELLGATRKGFSRAAIFLTGPAPASAGCTLEGASTNCKNWQKWGYYGDTSVGE